MGVGRGNRKRDTWVFTKIVGGDKKNLDLETASDNKPVRINSRNYTTSGNNIGFQSKPAQNVNGADIVGGEISPRLNSGFTLSGTIKGLHTDVYLKGTAAGTVSGDVRAHEVELVTDDAAIRTVSGDVTGIRMRAAFSGTITGKMVPFKIEKAEAQTNSKQWQYLFDLTGDNALVWREDFTTKVTTFACSIK